jgi:uncharacterized membrane protein YoaK (UPF0700 family)
MQGAMQTALTRGTLLSLLAGYVDTLGFILLAGLFTAHVTGNFVLLGAELAHPHPDARLKLLVFPAFVLGVVVARLLVLRVAHRVLAKTCLLQLLLLLASAAASLLGAGITTAGLLCAGAMGVQNAYGKLLLPKIPGTTVMTGNVTQLTITLVDAVRGQAHLAEIAPLASGVLAFAFGAMAAALASHWGFGLGLMPALLLLMVLVATAKEQ